MGCAPSVMGAQCPGKGMDSATAWSKGRGGQGPVGAGMGTAPGSRTVTKILGRQGLG